MAQPLPRFRKHEQLLVDMAKLERILDQAEPPAIYAKRLSGVTHGDSERLRGLPAIGRGVQSVSPGTQPLAALLAKERRQRPT